MTRFVPAPNLDDILEDATKNGRAEVAVEIRDLTAANVDTDTGDYERSLRVFDDNRGVGTETTDFAGHIIEWGSRYVDPQAPMRRAADTVGKFEET